MSLKFNPILFMVYFNRGNAKSVGADYDGALQDYTAAIEQDWTEQARPSMYFNRANTYADLHRFEEAVADYDKAGKLESPYTHFNKGNVLVALGRFGEARRCYQEAASKGMDRSKVDQNLYAVERIIHRIHGQEYGIDIDVSRPSVQATTSITIVGYDGDSETPLIVGNAGNSGNFGGQGQPGGKGFSGRSAIIVRLRGRNKDEG